jgi:hypothetical protein
VIAPAASQAIVASGEVGEPLAQPAVKYHRDMMLDAHLWEFDLAALAPDLFSPERRVVEGRVDLRPPSTRNQDLDTRLRKRAAELRETASIQNDRLADELEELLDNG